jgi:hypothetical protein
MDYRGFQFYIAELPGGMGYCYSAFHPHTEKITLSVIRAEKGDSWTWLVQIDDNGPRPYFQIDHSIAFKNPPILDSIDTAILFCVEYVINRLVVDVQGIFRVMEARAKLHPENQEAINAVSDLRKACNILKASQRKIWGFGRHSGKSK